MHILKQATEQLLLDAILLNKSNTKCASISISELEEEMNQINRAPIIITADSKE